MRRSLWRMYDKISPQVPFKTRKQKVHAKDHRYQFNLNEGLVKLEDVGQTSTSKPKTVSKPISSAADYVPVDLVKVATIATAIIGAQIFIAVFFEKISKLF